MELSGRYQTEWEGEQQMGDLQRDHHRIRFTQLLFNRAEDCFPHDYFLLSHHYKSTPVIRMRELFAEFELRFAEGGLLLSGCKPQKTDYGKSEFLAFVTKSDLFDTRRPRDESVASFAEALDYAQTEHPGNILGYASRILESRP